MDYDKLIEELYDGAHPQNKNWKAATAIETLRADLARMTAERDAAVKDIWVAKWVSCKHGEGCDFISAITGMPDCADFIDADKVCEEWEEKNGI